ncbi:thiol-disulfide oxidoreductase DCC family protein [Thaumasiovibrio subtropicus]|uniref:thiol-disulfide oxidoreductase DCC family protein n=1 Tax=Thaumasiovibrio subtropicus TaxID=1891207 RepID=UPI000B35E8B6|nr:DUF393 domain-containing protein [Thaumasiovibrio subtropicus]
MSNTPQLTLFYDGYCPLCVAEMNQLRALTRDIVCEDIHQTDFHLKYPKIDKEAANRILHAITVDGELLLGVDANIAAWQVAGKKPWLKVLRWPGIRHVADKGYLFFARHRYTISKLLTGKSRCERCEL